MTPCAFCRGTHPADLDHCDCPRVTASPRRLYCYDGPLGRSQVPVRAVLEYVLGTECRICRERAGLNSAAALSPLAVVLFEDGLRDTVPVASLEALLEDVSPM